MSTRHDLPRIAHEDSHPRPAFATREYAQGVREGLLLEETGIEAGTQHAQLASRVARLGDDELVERRRITQTDDAFLPVPVVELQRHVDVLDARLMEGFAARLETRPLVEGPCGHLRVQVNLGMAATLRQSQQHVEEQRANALTTVRWQNGEATDATVGQQAAAADGDAVQLRDGVECVGLPTVPFDFAWYTLLLDEHATAQLFEDRFVVRPQALAKLRAHGHQPRLFPSRSATASRTARAWSAALPV